MSTGEDVDYLEVEDLLALAQQVLAPTQVALRDPGALAASAQRPRQTVFGDDAYPTLSLKAGALLHSLARNHCLVDGNKRLAWVATRAFCALNGFDLRIPDVDAAERFVLDVAEGLADVDVIAGTIALHLTPRKPRP